MNVTNITETDYVNITDYENIIFANCTNNEDNFDIIKPKLILTIPCGLSFLC